MKRQAFRADGALLAMTAFWGVSFVIVKEALDHSDPFTFLALRFVVAGLACVMVARGQLFDRALWRPGAWLGLFLFLGFIFQTWGLVTTTPSRSAFITSLFVVFVPLVQWGLLRRRPGLAAVAGALLAIGGAWVLSGASFGGGFTSGDWLTLGSAAAYSVQIVLTGHWAARLDPVPLVSLEVLVVAVLACATAPFGPRQVEPVPGFVGAVIAMGVIATALGIWVQTWAQARTTSVRAALIIALEPVFATAWSIFRGREPFDPKVLLGGGLILSGVVVSELFKRRDA